MAETNLEKLERERKEKAHELALEKSNLSYDKLETMTGFQKDLISILHKTVAKNTTNAELAYFLNVCKQSGLNPINKEIWCYKDGQQNLIVFTGRDGFLKKNKENPDYRGMKHAVVCEFDQFEIDMVEGRVTEHKISNNRGKPVGAYCYVFIEDMEDTFVYLDFEEFDLKQAKWKTSPKMMIEKCAQSFALKEAAGITGIQAEESFGVNSRGVVFTAQDVEHEVVDKPEERLLALIEKCDDAEKLKTFEKECKTQKTMKAYDDKIKELKK